MVFLKRVPVRKASGNSMDNESLAMRTTDAEFPCSAANGYTTNLSGKFASVAAGASVSMDSGSMGSPSRGSDTVMATSGPNGVGSRVQHLEGLGDDLESPENVGGKKKKRVSRSGGGEKGGRGLRQFSMKVCEKVESKVRTTYNEVADELVAEFTNSDGILASPDQQQYDEKNIRRRVYDALNVLMAMDIISKEKKEIQWKGLPTTGLNDIEQLKAECMQIRGGIEKKSAHLQELEEQIIGIQNLIQRNENIFQGTGSFPVNGVALPFILVQTRPHATVEVEISEDMQLVHFDFNSTPFELHDDTYVLKAMGFCNQPFPGIADIAGHRDYTDATIEEDKPSVSSLYHQSMLHHSQAGSTTSHQRSCIPGKNSTSPPLPAILKARVKHDS
eukprot:c23662_g1_i1 orf=398-1564(-)